MSAVIKKEDAHKLVDQLPANATWDDLMHEIYVREAIEGGAGRQQRRQNQRCKRNQKEIWPP